MSTSSSGSTLPQASSTGSLGVSGSSSALAQRYVAPDFKRRQLLFDSFTKLGAAGGSTQKNITDQAVGAHGGDEMGPKGTLLYTWGAGYHGQLGLNTFRKKCRMMPACIDFKEPVLIVACGGFHTAVLTDDGRVYSWGDGRYGQLGNLARKHNMHSTPHLVDWLVSFKVSIVNISCGQYHTAAISNQGKLFSWGSGKWGQLGHGVRLDERFPRKVEAERQKMGNFTKVACGDRHTAALNDDGRVITFGSGQHGQLGHGNGSDQLKPVMINDPEGPLANQIVTSIDCGATTTAAVTSTGLFYLWGFGESIHPKGCSNIQDSPRLVKLREPVKQVACGQAHILVLTDAGDVYAFGMASMGQLGHGSRANVRNPRLVLRGKEIHQIAAGRYHSMAVSAYGVLYSWGCGESGQCGHNTLESELFPKICSTIMPSVVGQISCGEHHSFALTSIAHSTVSADVLNWKLIEDEELKLKRAMLADVPNGLKSKHILQVEQERKAIIRQLAESLKKEREDNGQFAQLQMSLIRQPEELVDDVALVQQQLLEQGDAEAIAQLHAMANAAARVMLTEQSGGVAFEKSAVDGASHSVSHSHRAHLPAHQEEEEEGGDVSTGSPQQGKRAASKRTLASSASEAVLRPEGRTLSSVASSPDLMYEVEEKQGSTSPSGAGRKALGALKGRPGSGTPGGLNASNSQPSLGLGHSSSAKHLGPLRPSTALTVALAHSQKSKARHAAEQQQQMMSRTDTLDGQMVPIGERPDSPSGEHRDLHAQAMVEFNPQLSPSALMGSGSFQPLAPRMAFAEQTVKALTWVKNMVAVNPNSANVVNYNVLRLQKQYNALKAEKATKTTQLESLKGALALCQPSAEEAEQNKQSAERIKQLNMKLVTLNTRLMEAEENKRNYELYIIRMKEEDLQLSKQIEHLRQLVTEYDRLLSKVERMSLRVLGQKGEIAEELAHFQSDIAEFIDFADRTVEEYRAMLNSNFKKNQRMDTEMERKMDATFESRSSSLGKLETALAATDASAAEHKDKLGSWEEKVEYYERRFRKLSNSTGLSRSEQIIAKHYFNCLPVDDHEIYTDQGFLSYEQVMLHFRTQDTLMVACHVDGALEYIPIKVSDVVYSDGAHELIRMASTVKTSTDARDVTRRHTNHLSVVATANHRMWVRVGPTGANRTWIPTTVDGPDGTRVRQSQSQAAPSFRVMTAGDVLKLGREMATSVAQFSCQFEKGCLGDGVISEFPFVSALGLTTEDEICAFLELYGYWLSDGSMDTDRITFSPTKAFDHVWLKAIFGRLQKVLPPTSELYTVYRSEHGVYIPSKPTLTGRVEYRVLDPRWSKYFGEQYAHKYAERSGMQVPTLSQRPPFAEDIKSAKWCWPWVWRLPAKYVRLIIVGLRCSDGNQAGTSKLGGTLYTSSVRVRDEMERLALHAGYSAHMGVNDEGEGSTQGVNTEGVPIKATRVNWSIHYSEVPKVAQPKLTIKDEVKCLGLVQGAVWCVSVPTASKLILARQVFERMNGVVTEASRPVIVGNSEITNDLKLDIEHKQDTLLGLQDQQKLLEHKLAEMQEAHTDSRWRDIGQLEEANVNAVARLLKAKTDAEIWAQKVTLVEEGLLQLARAVQTALAKKDGLTAEQQQALILVGSNALNDAVAQSPNLKTTSSSALIPLPERGLLATQLESAVEGQMTILLAAVEREKIERAEREKSKEEAERQQASRRRAQEEVESTKAIEMAKTFIAQKSPLAPKKELTEEKQ